jgi:hypothetical protein
MVLLCLLQTDRKPEFGLGSNGFTYSVVSCTVLHVVLNSLCAPDIKLFISVIKYVPQV